MVAREATKKAAASTQQAKKDRCLSAKQRLFVVE